MFISKVDLATINSNRENEILLTRTLSTLSVGRAYVLEEMSIKNPRFGIALLVTLEDETAKCVYQNR